MREIDFYKLSRAVQDNLLDSFSGKYVPRPMLVHPEKKRGGVWFAAAAGAIVLLGLLCAAGFGNVDSALSLHPVWLIALYALLMGGAVACTLHGVVSRARDDVLPFPAGVYLFPANVIDAREHVLRVYPLGDLKTVAAGAGPLVVLSFGSLQFRFAAADPSRKAEVISAIEAARDHINSTIDDEERRRLDPLAPPSVASPLTPDVARTQVVPRWEVHHWTIGALVGCVIGASLFFARNAMSDARMLAWARGRDDVASYKAYLARGRQHEEVVSRVLLARAALREAVGKGSVEAIDQFVRDYPSTDIQTEIDVARRSAIIAEFERVRSARTFDALLNFAERYPEFGSGPAFDQAKHGLYVRALEKSKRETTDLVDGFVARVVANAEKVGPRKTEAGYRGRTARVRFRRLPSKEMDRADELVQRSPMFNGTSSLPTRYLDPARFTPHEKIAGEKLVTGLARAFDPEILTFDVGPPFEGSDSDLMAVTEPTLLVNYRIESSGAAYASNKPRGIFLGLLFFFTTEFVLPGDPEPLRIKMTFSQRVPVAMLRDADVGSPAGALESAVYEGMIRDAFAEFSGRYLDKWFKQD